MPLLINTIGHASGALVFALSLYFLLAASSKGRRPASVLSLAAASLAFLWNFASLAVLACREFSWPGADVMIAVSASALSLLPAALLRLALGPRHVWIVPFARVPPHPPRHDHQHGPHRKISPLSSKRWLLKMSSGLEMIVSKRMSGVIRGEIGYS